MSNFPTLQSGAVSMWGASREVIVPSGAVRFTDDTEQRWQSSTAVYRFTLNFKNISGLDLENIRAFFLSSQGRFSNTWSIVFKTITYANCAFDQDDFPPVAEPGETYTFSLKIVQTRTV